MRTLLILAGLVLVTSHARAQATPPTNDVCLTCHAEPSLTRANGRPVVVAPKVLEQSAHGSFDCVYCHADLATTAEFPHPERLAPVDCGTCHDKPVAGFGQSVHAPVRSAAGGMLGCVACHGPPHEIKPSVDPESATNKLRIAGTCAQCHGEVVAAGAPRGPAVAGLFADSIHASALTRTTVAPTCSNCHLSHDIRRKSDLESPVHPLKVAGTCGACHMNQQRLYAGSVHAELVAKGDAGAPQCASCHTAHSITATTTDRWQLSAVGECGTCHREALATYRDTVHGQVTALGFVPVAKCADCHQSHHVLRVTDAGSPVATANRVATCQTCHPSANSNFALYQPHANKDNREHSPQLYYAAKLMDGLLFGVFAFFSVHTGLWFLRERTGRSDDDGPSREPDRPPGPAAPPDADAPSDSDAPYE